MSQQCQWNVSASRFYPYQFKSASRSLILSRGASKMFVACMEVGCGLAWPSATALVCQLARWGLSRKASYIERNPVHLAKTSGYTI